MLKFQGLCLLGLLALFSSSLAFAVQEGADPGKGTLITKTDNRTITTSETRSTNPDGSVAGTFEQFIKGKNDPEKLLIKGTMVKVDDKETFTLDETGRTTTGVEVENMVSIVRDLVGGVLIEKLTRKAKKKKKNGKDEVPDLGGLPAFVIAEDSADGSKRVKVFNNPNADPSIDAPDIVYDVPLDKPGVPPLDIFVAGLPSGTPGGTPPGGSTPPDTKVGLDPDVTVPPPHVPPNLPQQPPDVPVITKLPSMMMFPSTCTGVKPKKG